MFSKRAEILVSKLGAETHGPGRGQKNKLSSVPAAGRKTKNPQPGRGRENKIPAARPRADIKYGFEVKNVTMKEMMNFSVSDDDLQRFFSADDL